MSELTAEIRWWGSGSPPETVIRWFESGGCPPGTGERTDRYLESGSDTIGIKYRGGADGLEIKSLVCRQNVDAGKGNPLSAKLWIKRSVPLSFGGPTIAIAKRRRLRLFDGAAEMLREVALGPDETPVEAEWPADGCTVELTEVTRCGREWWSVCFEAFGTLDKVRGNLARTIDHLAPLPEPLASARQASYPQWLAACE